MKTNMVKLYCKNYELLYGFIQCNSKHPHSKLDTYQELLWSLPAGWAEESREQHHSQHSPTPASPGTPHLLVWAGRRSRGDGTHQGLGLGKSREYDGDRNRLDQAKSAWVSELLARERVCKDTRAEFIQRNCFWLWKHPVQKCRPDLFA